MVAHGVDSEVRTEGPDTPPPLENHVTIGFLSNTDTDPPQVAIEPFPIASGGRVV